MLRTVVNFSTGCYGNTAHRQESLPRASGSLAFSGVWKDEQLVKQEEVREGKSFPDRKGGLVKAELCSHRVWGGNKAIHCCVAPSARGNGQTGWRGQISGVRPNHMLSGWPSPSKLHAALIVLPHPSQAESLDLLGHFHTVICLCWIGKILPISSCKEALSSGG